MVAIVTRLKSARQGRTARARTGWGLPIGCAAIGSAAGIAGLTVLVEAVQQSRRSSSFPVAQPAERPAVQRSALTYADQVPLRRRHRRQLRRSQRAGSVGRVAVAEGGYGVHPGAFEALLDGQEVPASRQPPRRCAGSTGQRDVWAHRSTRARRHLPSTVPPPRPVLRTCPRALPLAGCWAALGTGAHMRTRDRPRSGGPRGRSR